MTTELSASQLPPNADFIEQWIRNNRSGLSCDDMFTAFSRAGRNHSPRLLYFAWLGKRISVESLRRLLPEAWTDPEFPERALTKASWREMFETVGYAVDGEAQPRPAAPLTLWRGAVPNRRRGWAWTDEYDLAQRFALGLEAGGLVGRIAGQVYTSEVPPEALLCRIIDQRPGESEYVIDTHGLTIVPAD